MDPTNFIISFFCYLTGLDDVYLSTSLMLTFNILLIRLMVMIIDASKYKVDFTIMNVTSVTILTQRPILEYSIDETEIHTRKTVTC